MKYIITLLFGFLLTSCISTQDKALLFAADCPENGVCRLETHKNTSLIIKKDDIGSLYHQMEESLGKTTFAYYYEQNIEQAYLDGHYIEEIRFEMNDAAFDNSFKNLKPTQILFGVFCYCKGKAGYYTVENALISYDKKSETITVTIDQIIENQILRTIHTKRL